MSGAAAVAAAGSQWPWLPAAEPTAVSSCRLQFFEKASLATPEHVAAVRSKASVTGGGWPTMLRAQRPGPGRAPNATTEQRREERVKACFPPIRNGKNGRYSDCTLSAQSSLVAGPELRRDVHYALVEGPEANQPKKSDRVHIP